MDKHKYDAKCSCVDCFWVRQDERLAKNQEAMNAYVQDAEPFQAKLD